MFAAHVILSIAVMATSPLSEAQRTALETAFDGRDHQEEAFAALVENAAAWTGGVGDEPVRLRVNAAALRGDPESARGGLFQIEGMLAQREQLPEPWAGVQEWFVRLGDGEPVIVYVVGKDSSLWREGGRIQMSARFYKIMNKVARDGQSRDYPAFVGASPSQGTPTVAGQAFPPFLLPALFVLLAVFAILFVFIRRRRVAAPRRLALGESETMDRRNEDPPLPQDPAAALEELRRRSGR